MLLSFSFGSKKRDLGDKLRNGEGSKNHRENSDGTSSLPDNVFSEDFNSPECAKILINLFKKYIIAGKRTLRAPQRYEKFSN